LQQAADHLFDQIVDGGVVERVLARRSAALDVGERLGHLRELALGFRHEAVELVFQLFLALGERAPVRPFGVDQKLLLLARELLQLVGRAHHLALHAAHRRRHRRLLRALQRRYHRRHLVEEVAGELHRALHVPLRELFPDLVHHPLHVAEIESLERLAVDEVLRQLRRHLRELLLERIQEIRHLRELLEHGVEILVAAAQLLERVHEALLSLHQIARRVRDLLGFEALADVLGE
jgi:hypothetical protein